MPYGFSFIYTTFIHGTLSPRMKIEFNAHFVFFFFLAKALASASSFSSNSFCLR